MPTHPALVVLPALVVRPSGLAFRAVTGLRVADAPNQIPTHDRTLELEELRQARLVERRLVTPLTHTNQKLGCFNLFSEVLYGAALGSIDPLLDRRGRHDAREQVRGFVADTTARKCRSELGHSRSARRQNALRLQRGERNADSLACILCFRRKA